MMDGTGLAAGSAALGLLAWYGFRRNQGGSSSTNAGLVIPDGAQIVDVRSAGEYRSGHAPGTMNLPLNQLERRLGELDPSRPVVLCCASGARSAAAYAILKQAGFHDLQDAGPWTSLP